MPLLAAKYLKRSDQTMESNGITKSQLAWIILRLLGIYFVYLAANGLFSFFQTVSVMGNSEFPGFAKSQAGLIIWSVFSILAHGVFGFYLLKNGNFIHALLMKEKPSSPFSKGTSKAGTKNSIPTDPETTLTEIETKEFETFLKDNPTLQKLNKPDQVARFRDHQAGL